MMFAVTGSSGFTLLPLVLILGFLACIIFILIFEIQMFIDAVRNPNLTDAERFVWCIGMVLVHPFVAIAYYFIASTKRRL